MNINLLTKKQGPIISKYIYGQFAEHLGRCIYEGVYVGEDSEIPNVKGMRSDVVEALKAIKIPVLRWPGGCFADAYHWKDGIGPKQQRKSMVNTHWGGTTENNYFGTHEFFELIDQLGCEAYVNGNMGSGTVQEMSEWVEYIMMGGVSPMADQRRGNGREEPWKMKFFGVGNESWGCGGNMRPEYYADEYRRYQTYVRKYGKEQVYKIACGANAADYEWTEVLMKNAHWKMDGLSLHYYTHPGVTHDKGSAVEFDEEEWYRTCERAFFMEELLQKHSAIMDQYDPEKRIGIIVDEWGTWFNVEPGTNPGFLYQQNTIRDAMVAAINLNIFHNHAERVHMANIAQVVNVLQAMILTEGEKMLKTPTYHVFDLYKEHMEANVIEGFGEIREKITYTASQKEGNVTISVCNFDLEKTEEVMIELDQPATLIDSKGLFGKKMNDYNDFDNPDRLKITAYQAVSINNQTIKFSIPPMSVLNVRAKLSDK